MLSPLDDLIGHQLPTPFDQIDNSDAATMVRLWCTGHPVPDGDLIFDIGLDCHPNRNLMDAFAGVAVPGRQWNFRAGRRLRPDPLATTVGPLSIQAIEGLRFGIEFHATMNAHEAKAHLRRRDGRVTENMSRAQQLGRYSRCLEIDRRRLPLEGRLHLAHEQWDLGDPVTRRKLRTLADQVIEVRDGDELGWGIIEYGVGKGYALYEPVQVHPPI